MEITLNKKDLEFITRALDLKISNVRESIRHEEKHDNKETAKDLKKNTLLPCERLNGYLKNLIAEIEQLESIGFKDE